jgi:hypothetical protein
MMNEGRMLKNKHLYYCYDINLATYLRDVCKFPFVCRALKKDTYEEFYLFIKTPALQQRVKQFQNYVISKL